MTDLKLVNDSSNLTNIPEQLQSNLHYFNLNNQLKYDLEQQSAIKMQQLEAIRLIQISLEKLTATTTVPLHNQTTRSSKNSTTPPPTILVYKETSLHKNLMVSKILNKAKYFYYQSIVQTMRLSLMSKLNYYSSLIQQINPNDASKLTNLNEFTNINNSCNNNDNNNSYNTNNITCNNSYVKTASDETSLIDEMKFLMQQILHDTYQYNSSENSSDNAQSSSMLNLANVTDTTVKSDKILKECSPSDLNRPSEKRNETVEKSALDDCESSSNTEQRIKQLNDVKHSLYSLLFPTQQSSEKVTSESDQDALIRDSQSYKQNSQNNSKRKSSSEYDDNVQNHSSAKRTRKNTYCSIDSNNNHVILGDDTNVIGGKNLKTKNTDLDISKSNSHKKQPKQHISTKLLKMSLKKATKPESIVSQAPKFNIEPESFINLEVLV